MPLTKNAASPLHYAAQAGRYWLLRQAFLDFGLEEFKKKTLSGESVLHFAFRSGNLDVINFLVDQCGLSLEDQDNNANTPLHNYFTEEKSLADQIDFVTRFVNSHNPKLFLVENNEIDSPFSMMPAQCEEMVESLIGALSASENKI